MKNIVIENLNKSYVISFRKKIIALNNVSLEINNREICGLIGQNGAGKTTLMKIILGLVKQTSGKYIFQGYFEKIKFGYVPESFNYDFHLKPSVFLRYYSQFALNNSNKQEIEKIYNEFDINTNIKSEIKNLSKGTKQKLLIIQSLIDNPDIIILDEPADGLDPISRKVLREKLVQYKNLGKIIIISSHILNELQMICDKFVIIDKGIIKDIIYNSESSIESIYTNIIKSNG